MESTLNITEIKGGITRKSTHIRRGHYQSVRTAKTTLPFNALGAFQGGKNEMVRPDGVDSNAFQPENADKILETLEEWNDYLEKHTHYFGGLER